MIQLFHVSKTYEGDRPALVDVNLTIEKGELVFLTGPSGAGKSTLLRLLFAAERPSRGQVLIDGQNIARLPTRSVPFLRRNMGVVFQDFKLLPRRTVEENVALALWVLGMDRNEVKRKVFQILKHVGLGHKRHEYPPRLSGGEQQRVSIARALVNEPQILLADEPTGSLDDERAKEIMGLLEEANARGTTMLIATHSPELYRNSGRRVLRLVEGRLDADSEQWDRREDVG